MEATDRAEADREAFAALVESRLDDAYRLARLILRSDADAQDAAHDAFLAAWHNRRSLRDPYRFNAWFDRILVNACRDRLRRRMRRPTVTLPDDLPGRAADASAGIGERDAIGRAFGELNADQRIVVALRFFRDLTIDEIAHLTNTRGGTVKSRLHHGLRRMRAAMVDDERFPG